MAKLTNTKLFPIVICATVNGVFKSVTVPAMKEKPGAKPGEVIRTNGSVEVAQEFIDAAKKSPVVAGYFSQGWLSAPAPAATTPTTPAKPKGNAATTPTTPAK